MFGLGLLAGIEVEPLAGGTVSALPPTPTQLVLERVTLAPGEAQEMRQSIAPKAIVVETGSLTVVDGLGLEAVYPVGGNALLATGMFYGLRNDGKSLGSCSACVQSPMSWQRQ
jgi:hypothetical protein